ncbi:sensor histidine kinase [Micromonospora sp. NPDC003197]
MEEQAEQAIGGLVWARLGQVVRWLLPWTVALAAVGLWFVAPQQSPVAAAAGNPAVMAPQPPEFLLMLSFALATGVAVLVRHRWRWPLWALAVAGWFGFSAWTGLVVAVFAMAETTRRRAELAALLGVAAVTVFLPIWLGLAVDEGVALAILPALALTLLLVGVPALAGLWLAARRLVIAGLRDRAARVESEQLARAEAARAEERARIAREMHDVLAHRVSLMVLHAGALEVNASDERTVSEAALIRTTGREALAELREVLGVLRSARTETPQPLTPQPLTPQPLMPQTLMPQPTLADLDLMLARSRAAGITVVRHDEGDVCPLPSTVERTGYRVVQEALTNVAKHAVGASVDVVVRQLPGALEIGVHNGPPTQPRAGAVLPGSGLGLVGLRERVELLGGQFHARPRLDGGFTVLARLPLPAMKELT